MMSSVANTSHTLHNFLGVSYVPEKVKHEAVQLSVESLGALTALTSATGFTVGGAGMAYETLNSIKNKVQVPASADTLTRTTTPAIPQDSSETVKQEPTKPNKDKKQEAVHVLKPETEFGKTSLKFAKVGVGFSGVAGVFNGLAMGFPLMAVGEGMNVAASPIIETPTGLGLFFMGLASVFASRALEKDERYKLSGRDLLNPIKVTKNITGNLGVLVSSAKKLGNKAVELVSSDAKVREKASHFFKDEVLNTQPQTIAITQVARTLENGTAKTLTRAATFSSPYLMHGASLLLGLGGAVLTASSLLNNKQGQKIGLTMGETGGSLDNLGLSKYGLERMAQGETLPGGLLAASGVSILAGQPGMDQTWGRAFQWLGCGLLFSVFVVDRVKGLSNSLQKLSSITPEVQEKLLTLEPTVVATRHLLADGVEATHGNLKQAYANFRDIEAQLKTQDIDDWKEAPKEAFSKLPKLYDWIHKGGATAASASA